MLYFSSDRALGQLAFKISNSSLQSIDSSTSTTSKVVSQFLEGLQQLLGQNVAIRKIISSLVVCFWEDCPKASLLPPLNTALTVQGGYEELVPHVLALQKDCHVSHCGYIHVHIYAHTYTYMRLVLCLCLQHDCVNDMVHF